MVDQEAVPLLLFLAVLPQSSGDCLAFLPGVHEYQTFLPPGVLKDISKTGVGVLGSHIRLFFQHRKSLLDLLTFGGLDVLHIEMLHAQPPLGTFGIHMGDQCFPSCAHGKEFSRCFRIADGGGQSDPPGVYTSQSAQPFDQTKSLAAPVAPEEGVDLVDDHEPQISE